jgi:hypothetical protein
MKILQVNQLVNFVEDDRTERILWIDTNRFGYVLIDIASKKALPRYRMHSELEAQIDSGILRVREVLIKPVFLRVESDHGVSPA